MESSDLLSSEFLLSYIKLRKLFYREDFFISGACLALNLALLLQCVLIGIEEFGDLFLGFAC